MGRPLGADGLARDAAEFVRGRFAEAETAPGRMERVAYRKGFRLRAEVCRAEAGRGTPDVADLRLANGMIARHVPVARFAVVAGQSRAA